MGLWFLTWQFALIPHVPGQGSTHFWLLQASFWGHSELVTHSGLQVGGAPMYPGTQEQIAWPLFWRHWELGPQGEGWQGLVSTGAEQQKDGVQKSGKRTCKKIHTLIRGTLHKCISTHSWWTRAHWNVINHITNSILTTRSWTWIQTFVIKACFIPRTVIVNDTFGTTHRIWIALIFG